MRHVMPSTDRRLELKEKLLMAQNAWQAFVYANGLSAKHLLHVWNNTIFRYRIRNKNGKHETTASFCAYFQPIM